MRRDQRSEYRHHNSTAATRPMTIPWPPIILMCVSTAAIVLHLFVPVNWPGVNDMPARLVGLGIGASGLLLILWAASHLYRARTTILPHKNASVLVTSGPFARFRNPIYLGDVMLLLGAAELTKNIWFVPAAVIFAIIVTLVAILPEEHHLEEKFGADYQAYKARTRRWI